MALVIGDAILSATISHIIDQLTSLELKFPSREKIHSDIKKLETNLHMICAVLDDAEEKQMESHAVKLWLEQIRDLAYDIEDLLDGVLIELTKERGASSSKARSAIPRFLSSLKPATFLLTNKMDSQIKSITARLQEIVQKKNYLDLRENVSGGELKSKSLKRLPSTSLVDLSYVCGRDNDKEEILKFLFSDQGCDEYGIDAGGEKNMEELYSCFNELLSRSFFQRSSSNEQRYLMHHLISDLAQSVAGETCVNLNDKQEYNKSFPDFEKARHISFTRLTYEVLQRFKDLGKLKRLRTFIALRLYSSPWGAYCYLSNNVLHEALLKLKHLRVLSLSGYCITELPNSIGDLKQLRYLNFSQTKIKQLPESVSNLINLQTLKLYGCRKLKKLPQGTGILINLCHLDITGTDNLIEMPSWMGNLTGLQTLSKFIVGEKKGCGIEELKGLKNLQGRLSIMDLHNVIDARCAVHANLRGKHNLDELELKWSESDLKSEVIKHHMPVLNSLQPHANLKELKISFYGGTEFPSWVGHPSFSEIVHLELSCCRKCTELPPLGRLPSLRDLCIQGLDSVEAVGPGFYGVGSSVKPFQSLKTLKFEDMREWKSWWSSAGVDEEEFPSLSELTLWNCPMLRGKLPSCLPSCVKITIAKCPMLVDSDEKLPVLSELELEECDEVTLIYMFHNASPTTLKIGSMSKLTCLTGDFLQSMGALKVLMLSDFPNLTSLWQKGTGLENFEHPQLVSLTEIIGMPSTHKSSKLSGCEHLPIHKVHMLLSLDDLRIESCPKLVSIPEAGLLSSLRHLVLRDCKALRSLPDDMSDCPLEDLEIEECPLLICFPRGMLPAMLKSLKIRYCTELKSLPEGLMHKEKGPDTLCHFEHLEIIGCPSLKSFPDGKLPTRLKTLKIWDCSKLKPLSEEMLHDDMSLQYLAISDCEALSSFPECLSSFMHLTEINLSNCSALKMIFPGVGLSLTNLRTLTIYNCKNLKSLPNEMQKLTSLKELTICSCPALESFPNGDMPPNLTSLEIWDCDGIDGCLSNWNLQSLVFLRDFSIAGQCFVDTVSFPDEKCVLPTTLTSIWIGRLPKLESLSMQLRSLVYLEELEIVDFTGERERERENQKRRREVLSCDRLLAAVTARREGVENRRRRPQVLIGDRSRCAESKGIERERESKKRTNKKENLKNLKSQRRRRPPKRHQQEELEEPEDDEDAVKADGHNNNTV
ncbi:hypothetical protein OIU85_001381 [Salix viminalis]|uniref:Rx N-terminal domain-containing protein n=1 Tax=Salix viminalis TaxID=40686 RepID=A0A9Q0ZXS0_SALVM|nr:hypothetical protein OIU85_001381 [Salix viminalis]